MNPKRRDLEEESLPEEDRRTVRGVIGRRSSTDRCDESRKHHRLFCVNEREGKILEKDRVWCARASSY